LIGSGKGYFLKDGNQQITGKIGKSGSGKKKSARGRNVTKRIRRYLGNKNLSALNVGKMICRKYGVNRIGLSDF